MKRIRAKALLLVALMVLSIGLAGCLESFSSNSKPTASFTVSPSGLLKVDMAITFTASASDPDGDSMTFEWNFGDSNTGEGSTVTHTYTQTGDYTVRLSVSDGNFEVIEEMTLNILSADAVEPDAEIATSKMNNCDDEEPPVSGTYILVWICDTMDESERDWDPTTTVTLDASGSSAGGSEAWLVKWEWDLNINVDSDNDGINDNDVDAEGETYDWAVPAGEWRVQVTVTDDQGMTAKANTWLYVNARATWNDIQIGRNNSVDDPTEEFSFPLTYDKQASHKLNRLNTRLVYPKEDPGADIGNPPLANDMNMFSTNETGEDVRNTSAVDDESRSDDDCGSDERCVTMTSSTGDFRDYLDGRWDLEVRNEEQHNADITELRIELVYK